MTQTDIDKGRLMVEMGIAPVKPAEFVIFRIGKWTGGSKVEELQAERRTHYARDRRRKESVCGI
jgi:hypothetical protein